MRTTVRFIVILSLLVVNSYFGLAQKIKTESGTSQIRVEKNMSKETALRKVEELAKINAIENAFNTYVEQEASLTVNSGRSDFRIIGTTKVKGEWIETIDKKYIEETKEEKGQFGIEKTLWITCKITGKIKEATPKANIEFLTLSCPKQNCRSTTFTSGEQLYVYFRSPLDGYLSIYLDDGNSVSRILPYSSTPSTSTIKVKADKEYMLFSPSETEFGKVDELELFLTCVAFCFFTKYNF
jgi:hypothetical protein